MLILGVCLGVFQGVFPLAAELVMPSGLCVCYFIMTHFIRSNDNWISLHPNVLTYWPFLSISYTVITEHRNFYVVCFSLDIMSRTKCPRAQFKSFSQIFSTGFTSFLFYMLILGVCLGVFQGVFPLAAELVMPSGLCVCYFIMTHFIRSNDNWISLHPNVLTYWPFLSISYTVITEHRNFYVVCFSLDIMSRTKCPRAQFKIQIQNHALLHQM